MDTERAPHNSKWYRYATTPKIVKMFRVRGYDVTGFTSEDGGYKTQIEVKYYRGRFYFNFEYFTNCK